MSTTFTIAQALELALGHHQAGRLGEAESLYRQVLAVEPRHPDALHLLGVAAHDRQKGAPAGQARAFPTLGDWTEELADFSDTAAFVGNFDLVIAADTSVAHLAGALGKPVWTLLPFAPEWRWGAEGGKSAWYPTTRLFRQKAAGDWAEVVQRVAGALTRCGPSCGS